MLGFFHGVFQVMMRMTEFVMRLAPIGVFGLAARVVAKTGFGAAGPLLVLQWDRARRARNLLPRCCCLRWCASPGGPIRGNVPGHGAGTPHSILHRIFLCNACDEHRLHRASGRRVEPRHWVSSCRWAPSLNHAGTALYECAAAMFIAQAYGLHLTFGHQFTIAVLALVTSMGIAGIPASSLVAITVILTAVGLPAEAIWGAARVRPHPRYVPHGGERLCRLMLRGDRGAPGRRGRDSSDTVQEVTSREVQSPRGFFAEAHPDGVVARINIQDLAGDAGREIEHRKRRGVADVFQRYIPAQRRRCARRAPASCEIRRSPRPSVLIGPAEMPFHPDSCRTEVRRQKRTLASRLALASPMTLYAGMDRTAPR